ncbi:DMT family transporter [Streptomyces sp. NPDC006879]|uniref:DMT family transporter n=1 Tax=Streptomyces sp. NPDC006879 TaxID=3364767 RepID=UPI0036AFFF7C
MWLPVVFAIAAAVSSAWATVLQRRAALTVPQSQGLRPGLILDLLRRPIWVVGILAMIGASAGQALALNSGPLSLVQPLFVLELPLALLIASLLERRQLPVVTWLAVAAVVGGLGVAMVSAAPTGNRTTVPADRWIPALVFCAAAAAALAALGLRRPRGRMRAACLGAATAIGYAMTAALMKAATHILDDHGLVAFLTAWQTYSLAAVGVAALLLLEHAMQGGPLVASQPALTLGDALLGLTLGIALYQEHLRAGWWLLPQLLGVLLVSGGVFALARTSLLHSLVGPEGEQEASSALPGGGVDDRLL